VHSSRPRRDARSRPTRFSTLRAGSAIALSRARGPGSSAARDTPDVHCRSMTRSPAAHSGKSRCSRARPILRRCGAEPTRCLVLSDDAILDAVRRHPELASPFSPGSRAAFALLVDRLGPERHAIRSLATCRSARVPPASRARAVVHAGLTTQQQAAEEIGTVRELVVRGLKALAR